MILNVEKKTYTLEDMPPEVVELLGDIPPDLPADERMVFAHDPLANQIYIKERSRVYRPFKGDWVRGDGDWPPRTHFRHGSKYEKPLVDDRLFLAFEGEDKCRWRTHRRGNDFEALARDFAYRCKRRRRRSRSAYAEFHSDGVFITNTVAKTFFENRIPQDVKFWPIQVIDQDGSDLDGFFLMAQLSVVDALDVKRSGLEWGRAERAGPGRFQVFAAGPVYFDKEKLKGCEFFQDRALSGAIYISKGLRHDLERAGVLGSVRF